MRARCLALGFLLVGMALGPEAHLAQGQDTLIMKDGRLFDGVSLKLEPDSIMVSFAHGMVKVPRSEVYEVVLAQGEDFTPSSDEERQYVAEGKVRYKGRWMSAGERSKRLEKDLEEKREAIEADKVGRLWRNREIVETKNFIFESTAPKHVSAYYRDLCEAYFQEFAKTWRIKRGKAGKLNVKFYVDQENYLQVTGMGRGVLGFFRFVEPYELNIYYDRLDPKLTEEVLFHELGHYLQKLINVEFRYPHWPGEALSEYYGASTWDPVKKVVDVGNVLASRVQNVQLDIATGEWVTIDTLLKGCSDGEFHDYTWGWTLVHFLMSDKRHSKAFNKFYVALANAKDIDRVPLNYGKSILRAITGETMSAAFRKYMQVKSDEELEEMQRDWYQHIEENLQVTSIRGLENAAHDNVRFGRRLRGKRMFEEAIEKGTENALTFFRYAQLLEDEGELKQARVNLERAIAQDGLVPQFYISLAETLLKSGTETDYAEGENLLHLALDIEPENFYLERNMKRLLTEGKRRLKASKPE